MKFVYLIVIFFMSIWGNIAYSDTLLIPSRGANKTSDLSKFNQQVSIELNRYLIKLANNDEFSGSVLLAQGKDILLKQAHGLASKRFNVENNVNTKFNLGSMNKLFTSISILQLVESGKLSLNDTLNKYLDESWLSNDVTKHIKIRHLLTHSSGLGSYFNKTFINTSKNNYKKLSDYKPLIKGSSLRFSPGTDVRYSNTGMFLLGVVIEKVSDVDYFTYVQENIYEKAGMNQSGSFEMDQPIPNLAIGYEVSSGSITGWKNNNYLHVLKGGPAGGGFSTVQDLHKFSLAILENRLLNKDFTKDFYSTKTKLGYQNFGYGIKIRNIKGRQVIGHDGSFPGIGANLDIFLDSGYIAVVLSNNTMGDQKVRNKIRSLLN